MPAGYYCDVQAAGHWKEAGQWSDCNHITWHYSSADITESCSIEQCNFRPEYLLKHNIMLTSLLSLSGEL